MQIRENLPNAAAAGGSERNLPNVSTLAGTATAGHSGARASSSQTSGNEVKIGEETSAHCTPAGGPRVDVITLRKATHIMFFLVLFSVLCGICILALNGRASAGVFFFCLSIVFFIIAVMLYRLTNKHAFGTGAATNLQYSNTCASTVVTGFPQPTQPAGPIICGTSVQFGSQGGQQPVADFQKPPEYSSLPFPAAADHTASSTSVSYQYNSRAKTPTESPPPYQQYK